ncbi:hypothetical protein [Williamsia serinedens]|uniref:Glycosyltransferase involved in cell wall bisynthesis n=1 Tax=Williamsia serinedens TaxID=391736 RepID=A0ABT1H1E3_9NOCA|nr:hypothetical protein [Williamsia serinedens]MCP2160951.1 Glycosyltransferase involved in cell wall bisynthesis [Williamsia serinedens]
MTTVTHLVVGPERHGVVRWACDIADALGAPVVRSATPDEVPTSVGDGPLHIHVTDRLFGPDATAAADRFVDLVETLGVPVGATLHDIPQPSDGGAYERRAAAYRRIGAVCRGVVVSSDHERSLLRESGWTAPEPEVIPLALTAPERGPRPSSATTRDVGVFGFVYPGKGHAEVLEAVAHLDDGVGVVAIGSPSPGHDDLVDDLRRRADELGRPFRITGFVDDADLDATLHAVAVPVAHHRHISASGSIPTWIAAGRRPLAPRGRYIDEFAERSPGVLTTYDDDHLVDALRSALDDPGRTWLGDVDVRPSWRDVIAMHHAVFARWAA